MHHLKIADRAGRTLWMLLLLALASAAPVWAQRASLPGVAPRAKFEPSGNGVIQGASLPGTWDDNTLKTQLHQYQSLSGKRAALVTWFASLYEKGRTTSWRSNYAPDLARVKRLGAVSLIKFSVQDCAYEQTRRMADLRQIARGGYDAYFEEAADVVRAFGSPVFISINHEMNGNWFAYSEAYPRSGVTADDYIASWRHIVNIFRRRGAGNAAFVWSPNVPDVGPVSFRRYYPGDDYVDWVGISFYSGNPIDNIDTVYGAYAERKPIFVTEWATSTTQNKFHLAMRSEAQWVGDFFRALDTRYPRIKAISWFQWNKGDGNCLLQRLPQQQQAYAAGIRQARYLDSATELLQPRVAAPPIRMAVLPSQVMAPPVAVNPLWVNPVAPRTVAPREAAPAPRLAVLAARDGSFDRRRINLRIVSATRAYRR